jgi:UDP-N-acetylmuramoylalanine--D-glutamate ligase
MAGFRVLNECGQAGLYFNDVQVDCSGFLLKGAHNLSNLAGVCTVADLIGLKEFRKTVDVRSFKPLEHRLEEFKVEGGPLCVDDSISTVPEATIAALKSYPGQDTVLLLGGFDRGQDYTELFAFLRNTRVKCVILLPSSGERIYAAFSGQSWPFEMVRAANLERAVKEATQRARSGELILLSPAAPSFGEFRNFQERGNLFKLLCKKHAVSVESEVEA